MTDQDEVWRMIADAIAFTNWAAGEGIMGIDSGVPEPEVILYRYSEATGDSDYETLPRRIRSIVGQPQGNTGGGCK